MTAEVAKLVLFGDAAILPGWNDDLTAVLLMLLFGMALGVGLTCLFIVVHTLRQRRLRVIRPLRPVEWALRPVVAPTLLQAIPNRWLAIQGSNLHHVQQALGVDNPAPCSWEDGLNVAHRQMVFLTPPVQGWILVFGSLLPDPADDVDRCYHFLVHLSRKLGEVQFFSFNRAIQHHAWARVEGGRVIRAYAWAGRTLWIQGPLTQAEKDLGMYCFAYGEGDAAGDLRRSAAAARNTDRVPHLAARWSLDPAALEAKMSPDGMGIAGQIPRSNTC